MMRYFLSVFSVLVLTFGVNEAKAQTGYELADLKEGEILLNLSAGERTEVQQDTLIARLEYTVEDKDRVAVQNEINTAMKRAVALAEKAENIKFSTENYHVYLYDPHPRSAEGGKNENTRLWRGRQRLMLKSQDSAALLELAGKLQSMGMNMTSLEYTLSPEKYEDVSDGLMAAALEKLESRADAAAEILGKSESDLIRIDLGGGNQPYMEHTMMARDGMMSAQKQIETPVAVPGMTEVSLSVSATALLRP